MDLVQTIGDRIKVVRLADVPGLPTELSPLRFAVLSGAEGDRLRPYAIVVDASLLDVFGGVDVRVVDSRARRDPWIEGLMTAADELRGVRP